MNVAHCIHGLGLGGAQEVIRQIVGQGDGDPRYFVYSCEDGVMRRRIEAAGATVRILPRSIPKLDPFWVARLARALSADRIGVVHTHLFGDSLHGFLAARAAGRLPVVMTLHIGYEGLSRLQRVGYRWLLARAERTVACSESVRLSYEAEGWLASRSLATLWNGIADPGASTAAVAPRALLRGELGLAPEDVAVAAVGRLVEQKGYRYLIEAVAGIASLPGGRRLRLVFLGEGELAASLRAQAAAAGIADRVLFAGFRDDLARLLPAFDAVAFSSLYEGLPIALLEAMAAGRCIVATNIPGIAEAVGDEREGLLVPSHDSAALGLALLSVAASPERRAQLGVPARRRFLDRYTAARMAAGYEALYREVGGPRATDGRRRAGRIGSLGGGVA